MYEAREYYFHYELCKRKHFSFDVLGFHKMERNFIKIEKIILKMCTNLNDYSTQPQAYGEYL
jgi:hypothetical protein